MKLNSLPPHLTGGNFLLGETDPALVFTPEDLSADEILMGETARKFVEKEVLTRVDALEHQEEGLAPKLFKQAGELGLLAIDIDEAHGGLGLGKREGLKVAEQLSRLGGFGVTCGAHAGIGTQPLASFGTDAQKEKYLSRLASGEWMAAYCLSEAGSGSDALGMKSKAVLSPDGRHYLLTGTKMWITNAAWADLFTVFAKVNGDQVTAFLVERTFPGVSFGREEHKLGIKTSSTRRVILEEAAVPVENVLGEVGKGAYIAFNILNLGRFGLGAGALGGAKEGFALAARYSQERQQFGRPIASFGLIQQKLAEMATRIYAVESSVYRTAALMDAVKATGELLPSMNPGIPRSLEEFAVECSILKVAGSETFDYVADEALQIHGGYGYTEEFPLARLYRDARINRIFEGTNEINRLVLPGTLLRRAQRGRFPLLAAVAQVAREILDLTPAEETGDDLLDARALLVNAKKLVLYLSGVAHQKYGEKLAEEQEILAALSDLIGEVYLGESGVLRALKSRTRSAKDSAQKTHHLASAASPGSAGILPAAELLQMKNLLAILFVNDSVGRMELCAREAFATLAEGDELRTHLGLLRRLLRWTPRRSTELRRQLAARLTDRGTYDTLVSER